MKRIYLDIDGVLLTAKHKTKAPGSIAFLNFILSKFDCYWLTTHCRDGNAEGLLRMLSQYYPLDSIEKMHKIKPTKWDTLKTEAIDFNSSFYWLDDCVFESEKMILKQKGCLDRLIVVNLNNENELLKICTNYLIP